MAYQKGRMVRFSIFGIPVQVQPFFWITLVILGGALGADSYADMLRIALFVLAGFVSILIHELGHALTARRFGAYSEITLHAFGGYASYTGVRLTRPQSFAVTAAGPLVQILLGLALWFSFPSYIRDINPNAAYFLIELMIISLFWAVLNLLPVLPLDGGRLLEALLGPQRIQLTLKISIVVALVAAVLMYVKTGSIIFPIFLAMFAWQAYQALKEVRWR